MFVLGIDPGLSRCGYGLVGRAEDNGALAAKAAGVLETDPAAELADRLLILHTELTSLMADLEPDAVVVERVFFQVNAKTAMSVGQASGLALVAASGGRLRGGPVHVERSEAGTGRLRRGHEGAGAANGGQGARACAPSAVRPTWPTPWRWPCAT